MTREVLKIYTDRGLGDKNNPTFHNIELAEYSYTATRMGMPQLKATLMWDVCLDKEWTQREYVVLRGERYYIRHTPTSEKSNTDARYKHELVFKSERDELLANVYFYDTVYSHSDTVDKPCSNSSKFTFYGNIVECVDRLNAALKYSGIGDSVLNDTTSPSPDAKGIGDGYFAVVELYGEGDIDSYYEFSFENKTLWEAITEFYEKTGVHFEFRGKKIIWNASPVILDKPFSYGCANELLSIKKTNANAKVINRITMEGSSENIPYFYPNESEYGHIALVFGASNKYINEDSVEISNYTRLFNHVRADQEIKYGYNGQWGWWVGDKVYDDLSLLGIKCYLGNTTDFEGETIRWESKYTMPYQSRLMPPKYRETKGAERFYDAENNTYKVPGSESEYLHFDNPYIKGQPCEHIYENENIKPTIEGIKNEAGQLFGEIAAVAFDENDNDNLKVVGEDGDALQYEHSFFYIKLNIFNGEYGFSLFQHASQNDAMVIQMTSGPCAGCKFKIQAVEKVDSAGFQYYENPVQTTTKGDIVEGDYDKKVNKDNIQEWQQDTQTDSIWICLQKDTETLGDIIPSTQKNYIPKAGDKFNIINIDLPHVYILNAEQRLLEDGLLYMAENNEEKFTFSISASRIFFAENPEILEQIDEYSKIKTLYDNKEYELYVETFKISCKSNEPLPDIQLELTDTIAVGESFAAQVANRAIELMALGGTSGSGNGMSFAAAERRYLSKQRSDRTPYPLAVGGELVAESDIRSRDFASSMVGGYGWKGDSWGHFEMQSLTLREFLEVPELRFNRTEVYTGISWHAPGGGIVENSSLLIQADGSWTGNIILKLEDGEIGAVSEGDICMGIWHFEDGITDNDTQDGDDGEGNFTFAGFRTIYFEILKVEDDEFIEEVTDPETGEVRPVKKTHANGLVRIKTRKYPDFDWDGETEMLHPVAGMHFVCYGNKTKNGDGTWKYPDRQTSRYATRTYERYLADVTDYTFGPDNIKAQFGDLSNLTVDGMPMKGYSAYLDNVYFSGVIKQLQDAKLIMTLNAWGDPYVGETRDCVIVPRVMNGVDDITSQCVFSVKTAGGTLTFPVNTSAFTLGKSAIGNSESYSIEVEATYTDSETKVSKKAKANFLLMDYNTFRGQDGTFAFNLLKDTKTKPNNWAPSNVYGEGEVEISSAIGDDGFLVTTLKNNIVGYRAAFTHLISQFAEPANTVLQANTTYTISFEYRSNNKGYTSLQTRLSDSSFPYLFSSQDIEASSEWRRIGFSFNVDDIKKAGLNLETFALSIRIPNAIDGESGVIQVRRLCLVEGTSTAWAPAYSEIQGQRGAFKSRAFIRTNTDISNVTPTGGAYDSPLPTSTVNGAKWSDGVPSGAGMLWSTVCTFYGDGTSSGWSRPTIEADTESIDIEFSPAEQNPGPPDKAKPTDKSTNNWYDPTSSDFPKDEKMIWRAERAVQNAKYVGDWVVTRIYGEKGEDAVTVQWETPDIIICNSNGVPIPDSNGNRVVTVRAYLVKGDTRMEITGNENATPYRYRLMYQLVSNNEGGAWNIVNPNTKQISIAAAVRPIINLRIQSISGETIATHQIVNVCYGKNGEDGKVGPEGPPGVEGPVTRVCGAFEPNRYYYDGKTPEPTTGIYWLDVVWRDNATGTDRSYYRCRKSGAYTAFTISDWEAFSEFQNLFADLLIANEANLKMVSSGEMTFYDKDGNLCGRIGAPYMDGAQMLQQNIWQQGTIQWFGGTTLNDATYQLKKTGFARFGQRDGERIELDPTLKEIRIYDERNRNVVQIDGKVHDNLESIYGASTSGLVTSAYATSQSFHESTEISLGTITVGPEGGHVTFGIFIVNMTAQTIYEPSPTGGVNRYKTTSAYFNLYLKKVGSSDLIELNRGGFTVTSPAATTGTSSFDDYYSPHTRNASVDISEGVWQAFLEVDISDYPYASVTVRDYHMRFTAGNSPKAFLGANGLIVANSSQDFLKAGMQGGKWRVELMSAGFGLLLNDGILFAKNSAGVWQELDLPFKADGKTMTLELNDETRVQVPKKESDDDADLVET